MFKPSLGIQLYTFRDHIKTAEDFDSTLARLSAMGVDDVQISGIGDFPAEEQRDILNKYGVSVCVTHKPFDRMLNDLDKLIEEHKTIGCDALGLGCPDSNYRVYSGRVRDFIEKATVIGKKLKENGMTFNYHNHSFEFQKLDDRACCMMDMLLEETDPETFHFIPDVAWMHYADRDPVELIKKMEGRIKVLHFKDYIIDEDKNRKFVSLGQGVLNFREIYDLACEMEIPHIVYEQDCDWKNGDQFAAAEESWAFLQSLR